MANRSVAARPEAVPRSAESADWAFHAEDQEVLDALVNGRHVRSLREYFGAAAHQRLSALAAAARRAGRPRGTRVLILPGIMGSKLGAGSEVLWIDPLQISAGRLTDLRFSSGKVLRPAGVLLFSYARLQLELTISGREALLHSYDWRLGIDELGAQLAQRIVADGRPVMLVAHSMGGLVARMAMRMLPKRWVQKLIMIGTPNQGSFASVQALRGTYRFVRRMARLDRKHSAQFLAATVFNSFPGLYHMLPRRPGIDLFDPGEWPSGGPALSGALLGEVAAVRARLAPVDSRMVHIVGVEQETVVGLRRAPAGFEYLMSRNGDGTVPRTSAVLPGLRCYFVQELHGNLANNAQVIQAVIDLVHRGRTRRLPARWPIKRGPLRYTDDVQLRRMESGPKIDWANLTSAQREAALGELDSTRLVIRE